MKFVTFVLFLIAAAFCPPTKAETCFTAGGQTGACINVTDCSSLRSIIYSSSAESVKLLKNLHCGFDYEMPKICCPNESTNFPAPPDVTGHRNLKLLDHDVCGLTVPKRINNGDKTHISDFPWMALIAYKKYDKNNNFLCGGTLINQRYVLTAAHCLTNLPDGVLPCGVRLGAQDVDTTFDCDKNYDTFEFHSAALYHDFGFESYHPNPNYDGLNDRPHDIGLIRLKIDVKFANTIRAICLPISSAVNIIGNEVTVTGWGRTENGKTSPDLLKIVIKPIRNDECIEKYKNKVKIRYQQMCAVGENGKSPCSGDSGGPLQSLSWYNDSLKYVQHGIVSFGPKCGTPRPDVFTRLAYYVDWVLDNMKK